MQAGLGLAGLLILAVRFTPWHLQVWYWASGVLHTALFMVRDALRGALREHALAT